MFVHLYHFKMSIQYKLFFVIFSCFSSCVLHSQALSGQLTIGGADADFPSIANAVNSLNAQGVGAGGVEFLIRDGMYSVAFTITANGAVDRPILFRSESGYPSEVVITTVISDDVITIDGGSYITFDNVSITVVGNNAYSAIEIQGPSNHIGIKNCLITGSGGTLTAYAAGCIYASEASLSQNCTDVLIENNVFTNGSYAFSIDMAGSEADSISFKNNICSNQSGGGIYMKDLLAPMVIGNSINTNQTSNTGYKGIAWNNCDGLGKITDNYIFSTGTGRINYGVELNSSAGSLGAEVIVANNSIQVQNENSLCFGLAQSNNCNFYRIFQNTIYVSGGSGSSSSPYQTFTYNADTDFFNNILVSESNGSTNRCVYIANQSGINFIDYNVYWTSNAGSNFTGYFGSAENSFDTFLAETNEQYSLLLDPMMVFVDGIGWRASNELLMNTGLFEDEYSMDIDGNTRPDPPCIGAHEINQISTSVKPNSTQIIGYHLTSTQVLFYLSNANGHIVNASVYGLSGKIVNTESLEVVNHNYTLERSSLSSGIYFIEMKLDDGNTYASKFIIP
jgi:hypothetical protein